MKNETSHTARQESGDVWKDAHAAWLRALEGILGGPSGGAGKAWPFGNVANGADLHSRTWEWWLQVAKLGSDWRRSEATRSFLDFWNVSMTNLFFGLPAESGLPRLWADSMKGWRSLVEAMTRAAPNGAEPAGQATGFYDSWLQTYEATVGKFVNVPMLGQARLFLEKLSRLVDSHAKFVAALVEFQSRLDPPWIQSMMHVLRRAPQIAEGGLDPKACRELYNLLIQTAEEQFADAFKSPPFTQSLATLLGRSLEFQQDYSKVMEEILRTTPVATKSDMNEVYRELYNLRKQLKQQKATIRELAGRAGLEESP